MGVMTITNLVQGVLRYIPCLGYYIFPPFHVFLSLVEDLRNIALFSYSCTELQRSFTTADSPSFFSFVILPDLTDCF